MSSKTNIECARLSDLSAAKGASDSRACWAWHKLCRAELNPVALLGFLDREQQTPEVQRIRGYLGPARLEFYQWEYGDPGHKPTCIWGDFVPPPKQPKPRTKPSTFRTKQENARPEDAITPAGFAKAFYEVNP